MHKQSTLEALALASCGCQILEEPFKDFTRNADQHQLPSKLITFLGLEAQHRYILNAYGKRSACRGTALEIFGSLGMLGRSWSCRAKLWVEQDYGHVQPAEKVVAIFKINESRFLFRGKAVQNSSQPTKALKSAITHITTDAVPGCACLRPIFYTRSCDCRCILTF